MDGDRDDRHRGLRLSDHAGFADRLSRCNVGRCAFCEGLLGRKFFRSRRGGLNSFVKGHVMPNSSASPQSGTAARALLREQDDAIGKDRNDDAYDAAISEGWSVSREVSATGLGSIDVGGVAESGGDSFGVTET